MRCDLSCTHVSGDFSAQNRNGGGGVDLRNPFTHNVARYAPDDPARSVDGNSELNGTFHCSLGTSSLTSAVQTPAPGWWYPLRSTNNGPSFNGPLTLSTHAEELDGHGVDAAREAEDGALVEVGADVEDVGVG